MLFFLKAAATIENGEVAPREHPTPQPGAGEVLVKVAAAGLNGDTIMHFGGNDLIDLTNINSTLVSSLGYSGNSTSGILTISDGTHSAAIDMIGNYSLASFGYITDSNGGTLIKFV